MTRLIHLSDLHFGRDRPELLVPLINAVNAAKPDLVAISGDLTQRARESQFSAARAFIDRIEAPVLSVPGNHDIPIHRPFTRFFRLFHYYKRRIDRNLTPTAELGGMTVIGLNTVDRYRWQRGRIRSRQVRRACGIAGNAPADNFVILVAHHPFEHAPGSTDKRLMRGADKALKKLAKCGVDAILSGHLHVWRTEPFLTRPFGAGILQVHAGTGLSTRQRGEPNDFACIDREGDVLRVARWIADEDAIFHESTIRHFGRTEAGWRTVDGQGPVPAGMGPAAEAPVGQQANA